MPDWWAGLPGIGNRSQSVWESCEVTTESASVGGMVNSNIDRRLNLIRQEESKARVKLFPSQARAL